MAHNDEDLPIMPFSCLACRRSKLKCDRLKPHCGRCANYPEKCQYPATRKKPVITATRPKVKALEDRLMHLEHRLKETQDASPPKPAASNPTPPISFDFNDAQIIGTGRLESLPPEEMMEELTNLFFTKLYSETPMIHPSRYLASLHMPNHMQPPMCLQYAIMALGALISPVYSPFAEALYRRARTYLENDEMRGEGEHFVTLAHCQSWILLSHFEVQSLWFSRASMSTSRSVRLSQILGLHCIDGRMDLGSAIPPPKDWCEQEERRRTMWSVFCADRSTSSTTGWPSLLEASRIRTLLPVSDEAFQAGIEEPSATLQEVADQRATKVSPFACRVLAAHLFHECLDHTYRDRPDEDCSDLQNSPFWKRHQDLNNGLASAFVWLPDTIRCEGRPKTDSSVFVTLQLHTALICLHRIGAARAKKYNLPREAVMTTKVRLLPSAQEIFSVVAWVRDINVMFRNPFVAFAAYMASFVFLEDFVETQNRQSEERMDSLLDLMISIGQANQVTGCLAIQMAHEIQKTGIDSSAMLKVSGLMADLKGPLMARQNESSGNIVFCPFASADNYEGAPSVYPGTGMPWSS